MCITQKIQIRGQNMKREILKTRQMRYRHRRKKHHGSTPGRVRPAPVPTLPLFIVYRWFFSQGNVAGGWR